MMLNIKDPDVLALAFHHQREMNTVLSRENQALRGEVEALQEVIRLYRRAEQISAEQAAKLAEQRKNEGTEGLSQVG